MAKHDDGESKDIGSPNDDFLYICFILVFCCCFFSSFFKTIYRGNKRKKTSIPRFSHTFPFSVVSHFLLLYFIYVFIYFFFVDLIRYSVILRLSYRNKLRFCTTQVHSKCFYVGINIDTPPFFLSKNNFKENDTLL